MENTSTERRINQQDRRRKNFLRMRKNRLIYNIMNLVIFGGLLFIILLSNNIIQSSQLYLQQRNDILENTWRQQVRTSLIDLKGQFLDDLDHGIVNPKDPNNVKKWAELRLAGRKIVGPGGDGFIIEFPSEIIIWDNSKDVPFGKIRHLGDALYLHADPALALKAYAEMRKIYSTDSNSKICWNFDGSPEFLEWIILPADTKGFNNEPYLEDGRINPDYKAFLLGYGIQKDEMLKPYQDLDTYCDKNINNLIILNWVITIGGILFIFWFLYRESRGS